MVKPKLLNCIKMFKSKLLFKKKLAQLTFLRSLYERKKLLITKPFIRIYCFHSLRTFIKTFCGHAFFFHFFTDYLKNGL